MHRDTLAIGPRGRGRSSGPIVPPIVQCASFESPTLQEHLESLSSDAFYTRYGNPSFSAAEEVVAALEGAEAGLVFASGMAATAAALLALARAGDHIVAQQPIFGGTIELLRDWLPRLGIDVTFAESCDVDGLRRALRTNTRVILIESPANPTLTLVDLRAVALLAREHGAVSVIDNTFATPINQQPHSFGFDLVVHSGTKYLSGHSDLVCGAVTGSRRLVQDIAAARRCFGGVMDPHASWLLLRGMRTLPLRVVRQNATALAVAQFLTRHPAIGTVHYPFLPTHPQIELARRQMTGGGGMISFELREPEPLERFLDSLALIRLAGSLGGVESSVTVPALTTHRTLTAAERARAGIPDALVRLSVGLEHEQDLIDDLDAALQSVFE